TFRRKKDAEELSCGFEDIFKPLGIRRMESLPGGIGVMMDDILSGVYGFIILIVARWIIS
ncbi:phosphatidylglycerophosphatase A, partial [Bacteroides uniformis]|uniref:phosphatidylglycerophosphatase A n=1 Tax=Bacteroides uniformis TaxID=820 RepID=UPI000FF80920